MGIESQVERLVHRFRDNLSTKEHQLRCFSKYAVQLEGWLKGELLCFLDKESRAGNMNFDREVSIGKGRRKVDVSVAMPSQYGTSTGWIELKHWLIGSQKGTKYDAEGYFTDPVMGIKNDVEKLAGIHGGSKFLLVLATGNPGIDDWNLGIRKFNAKFHSLHLTTLTHPGQFPDYFFIGLLSVSDHASPAVLGGK